MSKLTPKQAAHIYQMVVTDNATDQAIRTWLAQQGFSERDASEVLDVYVYGGEVQP